MDERPLVSVVIPTRNRADLLSDALGSLVEQDYPADRYEILVVDDGSIDDTPSVVEALAQAHSKPRLSLLRQPAKNQNAARNRGVSEAKGELIAFLDDDELAPANWLSGLVAGFMRHPDADVVGGPYRLRLEASTPRVCEAHWPGVDGAFGWGVGKRSGERRGRQHADQKARLHTDREVQRVAAGMVRRNGMDVQASQGWRADRLPAKCADLASQECCKHAPQETSSEVPFDGSFGSALSSSVRTIRSDLREAAPGLHKPEHPILRLGSTCLVACLFDSSTPRARCALPLPRRTDGSSLLARIRS